VLAENYDSRVIDRLRELGHVAQAGDLRLELAREFGFCYGVERAVEYAYQTRQRLSRPPHLPLRRDHPQPRVNGRIESMGIRILPGSDDRPTLSGSGQRRRGLLPAFGVPSRRWSTCAPRAACW